MGQRVTGVPVSLDSFILPILCDRAFMTTLQYELG